MFFADLIAIVVFGVIAIGTTVIASSVFGRRRSIEDPVTLSATLFEPDMFGAVKDDDQYSPPAESWGWVVNLLAGLIPQLPAERKRLGQELLQAGYFRRSARTEFLAIRNCIVLAIVVAFGLTALGVSDRPEGWPQVVFIGLILAITGYSIPRLYIQSIGQARLRRIQRGLPDSLELISMCMAGGLSFHESLERVARDIQEPHPDLSTELQIVRRQIELGSLEQAFRQFSARLELPELKSMNASIVQAEKLGSNLVAPLESFAADLRRARRQEADARASSIGVKMLFPIILLILPATVSLLWGPAVLEFRDFWLGEQTQGGALSIPNAIREAYVPSDLNNQSAVIGGQAPAPPSQTPPDVPTP